MRFRPGVLQVTAGGLWAGAIAADAMKADSRVWVPLFAAAAVASWGALQYHLISGWVKADQAMTRAVLTRPVRRDDTGPLAAVTTGPIPAVSLLPAPGAAPAARHRQRGQHASR